MPVLFARAGLATIPGASHLPFVGPMVAGGGRDIPDLTLRLTDVEVEGTRLADYDGVCGFALKGVLPADLPTRARVSPAALADDRSGLSLRADRTRAHRQPDHAAPAGPCQRAPGDRRLGDPVEDHPRGKQFSLLSEVRVGDELVWEEVSTNLKRGRDGGSGSTSGSASPDVPNAKDLPATATWQLSGDLGRRYASVSGDYNPIHIHPLSARLFGFPSAIAHGMWTEARCLAALEPRLPDAFTVEVAFKRPILLPGKVEFCEAQNAGGMDFGVRDPAKRKSHLDGRVTFD